MRKIVFGTDTGVTRFIAPRQLQKLALILAVALLAGCGGSEVAQLNSSSSGAGANGTNGISIPTPVPALTSTSTTTTVQAVDTTDRNAVLDLYNNVIVPAFAVTPQWTGTISGCQAGDTSAEWKTAVVRTVNSYRVLAGLPGNVTLNMTTSALAQQAALMMEANWQLSHSPPTSWLCYSEGGATAASQSNIALGVIGPEAMRFYMSDRNVNSLGHRRGILYSKLGEVGTGDSKSANALWIVGLEASIPASVNLLGVAWPPRGYVPWTYKVANPYDEWSFSLPGADFSVAVVTMTNDQGQTLALSSVSQREGYGDNTIGWKLAAADSLWSRSPADTLLHVEVNNVIVNGYAKKFAYDVIFFVP